MSGGAINLNSLTALNIAALGVSSRDRAASRCSGVVAAENSLLCLITGPIMAMNDA